MRNLLNNDGSFILLGEQRYDSSETYSRGNSGLKTRSWLHYDNIMTTKINADGSLAWMHKLPKRQKGLIGKGKGIMSYAHMFAGDNHYLMYLDNYNNLDDNGSPFLLRNGFGGFFTISIINDKSGEVKKDVVFQVIDLNGVALKDFQTNKILPLSDSEILLEGLQGRKKGFLVKVTAKNK
ncbi:hypothetical protein [uncultured Aquimarina sp.]|uniref:hypothetical protein n=1 Tax=uncultured Aquimarina sp. TaxID=575652 RepID=UPI002636A0C0|nr:hypothetical protein [uncultured Aquimarina sp.]